MNTAHSLAESSFSGKIETIITMKLLAESPRRIKVESAAPLLFVGTLPEEEREVHHRDHENRKGCDMDRFPFME